MKVLTLVLSFIGIVSYAQPNKYVVPSQYYRFHVLYPYNGHFNVPNYSYDTLANGLWLQFYKSKPNDVALAWTVKDGKKDGAEIFVSIDGLIEKVDYFRDGSIIGSIHYFKTGSKKDSTRYLSDEMVYRANWFENGNLEYEANNSSQVIWYDNNHKKIVKQFSNAGLLDGEVVFWYANGIVKYKGLWSNGNPVGTQEYRRRPSRKLKQVKFENIPKTDQRLITNNVLRADVEVTVRR